MSRPKKLPLTLPTSLRIRLESLAIEAGLDLDDYAVAILSSHAVGGGVAPAARRVGRPISVKTDDLPADLERASNAAGFAGVVKLGRLFVARAGKQTLGRYSTPELAALVRYHELRGFRTGRGAAFHDAGLSVEVAVDLAARAGFGAPATQPTASSTSTSTTSETP